MQHLARRAVRHADKSGRLDREQAALGYLYDRGHFDHLPCKQVGELQTAVREACRAILEPV